MHEKMVPPKSMAAYHAWAERRIDCLNRALEGIPRERARYHICWGSWNGPHMFDVPLKEIAVLLLKLDVGGLLFENANPRHEHEWTVWEGRHIGDRILIPGVISHATNGVEHPELVAQRLVRLANIVGREQVTGGADCGFAQSPFAARVHVSIIWAKLRMLSEGCALATKELSGKAAARGSACPGKTNRRPRDREWPVRRCRGSLPRLAAAGSLPAPRSRFRPCDASAFSPPRHLRHADQPRRPSAPGPRARSAGRRLRVSPRRSPRH